MSFLQIPIQTYPNTALGYQALTKAAISPPFSGQNNTAFGDGALRDNTTGYQNVAVGKSALFYNTTGNNNTAVGMNAAVFNITGGGNTAIGAQAFFVGSGNNNTAIGSAALAGLTNSIQNVGVGWNAGSAITTGSSNVVLGNYTGNGGGYDIRTLSNYVVIADGSGNPRIIVDPAGLVSAPGGFSGGGGGGGTLTFNNQTAAYTVVSGDLGKIVNCTSGTFTVSLTAAATLGSGFNCWIWNTGGGVITIDPNGAETIDGVSTLTLRQGEGLQIVCTGTNWETGDKKTMRGYAENLLASSTRPVASGSSAISIGPNSTATSTSSVALGYFARSTGAGGIAIGFSLASGSDSIAVCGTQGLYSATASNSNAIAIGSDASATSSNSTAIGRNSANQGAQAVSGAGATSIGGSYVSGTDSFAAAVANNSSSYGAKGANSIAIGQSNNSTASGAATIGGILNTASGSQSVAVGGNINTASGVSSFATGYLGDTQNVELKAAFGNGFAGVSGSCQLGIVNVKRSTTNATPTVLNVWDSATPNANNMPLLQNNSAFAFSGTVVARQQASGGTQSAAWRIEGLIRREANAASTTLVASTVTVISNVPGWTLALSADTTIGALALTATGAAGTNIRWVGNIQTSECIYA